MTIIMTITMPIPKIFQTLRQSFNLQLTCSVLVICISQINYGFDNQGYPSIQSLDQFAESFGRYDAEKKEYYLPTVWLSMFNSIGFLGLFVGVVVGSMVSVRFGRRWCMFSMSLWAIVTATITFTSKTKEQIMVGRVLNYLYTGMELSVVPVFQSEITPKKARGFVVGTYQLMLTIGGVAISAICYRTQTIPGPPAFKIPFGMFYIIPSFVICAIWTIPESPRWLALRGRHAEGLVALRRLRAHKFSEEEIDQEWQSIVSTIRREREAVEGTTTSLNNFKEMFRGSSSNKRRTTLVLVINFFLQATGQSFSSQYGALFIKSLGTVNQFTMSMIQSSVNVLVTLAAMLVVDTLGRRRMLMYGGSVQVAALMAMGGLGTVSDDDNNNKIKSGIVATMVLYVVGYSFGWAPVVHTLSTELPSATLRDVTYRTGTLVNVLTNFLVAFTLPYLLNEPYAGLGSKVGFIYGSIAFCSVIFAFLFIPDCRGRSLEEINRLFESGVPARKFHEVVLNGEEERLAEERDGKDGGRDSVSVAHVE